MSKDQKGQEDQFGQSTRRDREQPDVGSGRWFERLGKTLFQAGKDFGEDNGPQWAAAVAYYALLSVFPLLLAIASIAAFFVDQEWVVQQATDLLGRFLPQGQFRIEEVVQGAIDARGGASILSIAALLWSGSRVFSAVTQALNIAFDVEEEYGFLKRILIQFLMLLTIGLLFVLALSSRWLIGWLWGALDFLPGQGLILSVVQALVPALLLFVAFFLTYRFVPRTEVDWKAAAFGAVLATLGVLVARPVFVTYVQRFANYNLIYGSLAIVIILVFWAWIVASILLLGGEIVSHVQGIMIEGRSPEEIGLLHRLRRGVRKLDGE